MSTHGHCEYFLDFFLCSLWGEWTFYSAMTFLHLHLKVPYSLSSKDPHQILFCYFLFHIFIPLYLFALSLEGLPPPKSQLIFIPLIFILPWPFCTYTRGSPPPKSRVIPTNFYSANFYSRCFLFRIFIPLCPFCTYTRGSPTT